MTPTSKASELCVRGLEDVRMSYLERSNVRIVLVPRRREQKTAIVAI